MDEEQAILVVGGNPRNLELLAELLGREGYRVVPGDSVEACDQALCCQHISLALIDIAGFDLRLWEGCERLRGRQIPILVLSRRTDRHVRQAWLAHGARAVLAKPLAAEDLLEAIRLLLG